MKKLKFSKLILALLCSFQVFGQDGVHYQREFKDVSGAWKKVKLPDDFFDKTRADMHDVRVYGITDTDSIEVPYLIQRQIKRNVEKRFTANLYNKAKKGGLQYLNIEFTEALRIDEMELNIKQDNFDVWYDIEGSNDAKEWFRIAEKQRIIGIAKGDMDYHYTTLSLPSSSYAHYRLICKAEGAPEIKGIYVSQFTENEGEYSHHTVKHFHISNNKEDKTSTIDIRLENKLPVSQFHLDVIDDFEYYRNARLSYLKDSVQLQNGKWRYNYRDLDRGILNSSIKHQFDFNEVKASVFRVTVYNKDNTPLQFSGATLKGPKYNLLLRFPNRDIDYVLVYGTGNAQKPVYDLKYHSDKIPNDIPLVVLGEEKMIFEAEEKLADSALLENKWWLWTLMGISVLLLGGFSMKMLKEKPDLEENKP